MPTPKAATRRTGDGGFRARVLATVRAIPRGRVATYGDVAELAGAPGAARAVGNVMRACGDPSVPCHRVIAAAGALGGYGGFLERKRQLLRAEGLVVTPTRIRGFADVRWPVQPHPGSTARRAKAATKAATTRHPNTV